MSTKWTPTHSDIIYEDTFDAIVRAFEGTFIASGLEVTAQGSPDQTVAIASGSYYINGVKYDFAGDSATPPPDIAADFTSLSAGQEQYIILHINTSGTVARTAGSVDSPPPTLADDLCPLATILLVKNTNVIQTAHIQDWCRIYGQVDTTHKTITIYNQGNGTDCVLSLNTSSGNVLTWSGGINLGLVNHASGDTDKFLVLDNIDSGEVKYRTGAEVIADANHTHVDAPTGGTIDHTVLTSKGSNTHAAIDTHIGNSALKHTKVGALAEGSLAAGFTSVADDRISSAATWSAKQDALTFGKASGNALKTEEAIATGEYLRMGTSNVDGLTAAQVLADIGTAEFFIRSSSSSFTSKTLPQVSVSTVYHATVDGGHTMVAASVIYASLWLTSDVTFSISMSGSGNQECTVYLDVSIDGGTGNTWTPCDSETGKNWLSGGFPLTHDVSALGKDWTDLGTGLFYRIRTYTTSAGTGTLFVDATQSGTDYYEVWSTPQLKTISYEY